MQSFLSAPVLYRVVCSYCPGEQPNEATGELTLTLEDGSVMHPPVCQECAERMGAVKND